MTPLALLVTAGWGGLVGLASGLLGIGGGVLVVPFLYVLFAASWSGVSMAPELVTAVAHATSLFVVLPTSVAGLVAYQRTRTVPWRVVVPMGVGATVAAFAGARLAVLLPPGLLRTLFGLMLVIVGLRMWPWRREGEGAQAPAPAKDTTISTLLLAGSAIGLLSSLLGVGGGVVAIPILLYLVKVDVSRVAAASIGVVAFAAPAGVLSYVLSGWGQAGLPSWSFGFIHLPTALVMISTAVLVAPLGARWNRSMDPRHLKFVFGGLFLVMGSRLVYAAVEGLIRG